MQENMYEFTINKLVTIVNLNYRDSIVNIYLATQTYPS